MWCAAVSYNCKGAYVKVATRAQVAKAWQWSLLVQAFSWYMQIHPGHAVLEGRKPALLDSLAQVGITQRCSNLPAASDIKGSATC